MPRGGETFRMLKALYIIVDDEADDPIYGDPPLADLDEGVFDRIHSLVQDLMDGEVEARGTQKTPEGLLGWRSLTKTGLTFVAMVTDTVRPQHLEIYLQKVAKKYVDEVDDWRSPDRGGVSEVVLDVIPPWEEDAE